MTTLSIPTYLPTYLLIYFTYRSYLPIYLVFCKDLSEISQSIGREGGREGGRPHYYIPKIAAPDLGEAPDRTCLAVLGGPLHISIRAPPTHKGFFINKFLVNSFLFLFKKIWAGPCDRLSSHLGMAWQVIMHNTGLCTRPLPDFGAILACLCYLGWLPSLFSQAPLPPSHLQALPTTTAEYGQLYISILHRSY